MGYLLFSVLSSSDFSQSCLREKVLNWTRDFSVSESSWGLNETISMFIDFADSESCNTDIYEILVKELTGKWCEHLNIYIYIYITWTLCSCSRSVQKMNPASEMFLYTAALVLSTGSRQLHIHNPLQNLLHSYSGPLYLPLHFWHIV